MFRSFFKGCFVIVALALIAIVGLYFYLKHDPDALERIEVADFIEKTQSISWLKDLSPERVWTDVEGKTLTGVFIAGSNSEVIVRIKPSGRVYRIPLSRLSETDREYVSQKAIPAEVFRKTYPPTPDRWPQRVEGRRQPLNLQSSEGGRSWTSTHYEFESQDSLDPQLMEKLAMTCEAVDVALRQSPLPLLWGRDGEKRRLIKVYQTRESFLASGSQENWGAYYAPHTNIVHVPLESLTGRQPLAALDQFSLRRRDDYKIMVHELVHQASARYLKLGVPAWVAEGTAELYSAMQTSPGQFNFQNPQTQVRRYLSEQIDLSGRVRFTYLQLPRLDEFMKMGLFQFNKRTAASGTGGMNEYAAAMLLTEYFAFADQNALRPYLEAVFTRVPISDAMNKHLLRGRSPGEIENDLIKRWSAMNLDLEFTENPEFGVTDHRALRVLGPNKN